MIKALWRWRASIALVFIVSATVVAGSFGSPEEDECAGSRIIKESGLAYYCLLSARAFTNINGNAPAPQVSGAALSFEENVGQADRRFDFLAHSLGGNVYLSKGNATFDIRGGKSSAVVLHAYFAGAGSNPEAVLEDPLPGHVNYFLGNQPDKWITDIPTFGRVRYRNVYPGIDVVYYGANGTLEHDVVVQPGANPATVAMAFQGAQGLDLESSGSAVVKAAGRRVEWKQPVIYQEIDGKRVSVDGRYRKNSRGELAFEVGRYDSSRPLVIDPVVTYASYRGNGAAEGGSHIAIDQQGNTYVSGFSRDQNFAVTPGAFTPGTGFGNHGNGFVIKYNATNTAIVYATYFGGGNWDSMSGVAVDSSGNVYLAGVSDSDDYPVTKGALKTSLHTSASDTSWDCVVTKLNPAGNALVYSTYVGGPGNDACSGIAIDPQGNAYLTGATTNSFGFPLSDNAPFRVPRGPMDAFIVKLNPTGSQVVYGTLLGGSDTDSAFAIAVDAQGAAYVTGQTISTNFPVTAGAYQTKLAGTSSQAAAQFGDVFVAKLSPDGGTFQYITYLGGKGEEIGWGIAVDSAGDAYITGSTTSQEFPVTAAALKSTYQGGGNNPYYPGGDAFVAKLNPTGTALLYSTYLGGSKDDWGTSIVLDNSGNIWVAGATLSANFPVTSDAYQKTYAGGDPVAVFPTGDAWVVQLNPSGTAVNYGTYIGGKSDDFALSLALDAAGNAWVTGSTRSGDFPTTTNAVQKAYGGTDYTIIPLGDAFITKVSLVAPPPPPSLSISSISSAASYAGGGVAPGEIVVLTGTGIGPKDLVTLTILGGNKVATQAGDTQVLFDDQPAPVLYASAGQTSAIVPYAVTGKSTAQVVIVYNGSRSAALPVTVLPVHPALFSANASGRGPGAILNEDYTLNTAANPALKGHYIQLYGTGEGQTSPAGVDGALALVQYPKPLTPVTVTVGGQPADVVYYGAAPQAVAGLLQVNAKVPDNIAAGNQDVILQIGTAKSQTDLTVAVQ